MNSARSVGHANLDKHEKRTLIPASAVEARRQKSVACATVDETCGKLKQRKKKHGTENA